MRLPHTNNKREPLLDAFREELAVINLDEHTIDPAELREVADTLIKLAMYARLKANAMEQRSTGRMRNAEQLETRCENIYQKLPDWAKW